MTEQQAAYLAGAIAHANDSLDWIEAGQLTPIELRIGSSFQTSCVAWYPEPS